MLMGGGGGGVQLFLVLQCLIDCLIERDSVLFCSVPAGLYVDRCRFFGRWGVLSTNQANNQ